MLEALDDFLPMMDAQVAKEAARIFTSNRGWISAWVPVPVTGAEVKDRASW